MKEKLRNKKGFTLVELIVVIAILVILVGLLAPNVIRYIEKSRAAKDKAALDNAYQSIMLALADEEAYTAAEASISTGAALSTITGKTDAFATEVKANYGTSLYTAKSNTYRGTVADDADSEIMYSLAKNGSGYTVAVWFSGLPADKITNAITAD
ncbi:type II secretion system protein [Anaerolentibacter hominis]|uniref:type II secretion system protein n=1 Tax=Anaerolentibacter hominis TaxID=3079009 RepID=UPI0031B82531